MDAFLPIGLLFIFAIVLCLGIYTITNLLGPSNPSAIKLSPYECGIPAEESAQHPFKSRFYLIAVLFLLFDVEAAFLFPWALVYRSSIAHGPELFVAFIVYVFLLTLGLVYVLQKKCLELN